MSVFQGLSRLFGVYAPSPDSADRSREELLSQAQRLVAMGLEGAGLKVVLRALAQAPVSKEEIAFLSAHRHRGGEMSKAYAFRVAFPVWEAQCSRGAYREACTALLDAHAYSHPLALDTLARAVVLPPERTGAFRAALSEALEKLADRADVTADLNRRIAEQSAALHRLAVQGGGIGSFAHANRVWRAPDSILAS
jgi:hypothetical protein